MASDGLLPPVFGRTHSRFATPWISQLAIGGLVAIVAAVVPIELLAELVGVGALFAFIPVCVAVIYLRSAEPLTPRPFRVPQVPWVPLLGIASCLGLMAGLAPLTWLRLLSWLGVGLAVYFTCERYHSRLTERR